ncbi:hypothetical protein GJ744_005228 [Endocarpon pusillum]|uniref:Uncharacterized protein n=1 Tax=Endocarpon pusillum TaxID=364733 RepID=A0A8H7DYU2_9EURO|nr:hypothetical protein GJ744_005228 [Endocarpon pusillum]
MEVLSYQPHSGKYSPFPQGKLLPTSKFLASSSRSPTWRQSSISSWNKPSDGVSQLHGTDNVDGGESSDDELPSLQKLLSPATQAYQAELQAFKLLSASQNPHYLNPSVQAAKSSAPPLLGTTPTPRKSFFKNIPAWSFLNSLPADTPTSTNQAKTKNEPAVRPSSRGSSIDGSVGDGRRIGRGNSQESPIVINDDEDGDLTDRSNHTSHQMTVNDPGVRGENIDGEAGSDLLGPVSVSGSLAVCHVQAIAY